MDEKSLTTHLSLLAEMGGEAAARHLSVVSGSKTVEPGKVFHYITVGFFEVLR